VSGSHNPETEEAIARSFPAVATQLRETLARLEQEFGDVQDVEYTIEEGKLWILQTRSAKRTPLAALRFAIAFVKEGLITPSQALRRLNGLDLNALARKRLVDVHEPVARGTGASAGIAVGRAAFDSGSAERLAASGDPVILVRPDTSTSDVAGFAVSAGIVTAVGAEPRMRRLWHARWESHASSVLRRSRLMWRAIAQPCRNSDQEGDWLSIDGEAGTIYLGQCNVVVDRPETELAEIERWRIKSLEHL